MILQKKCPGPGPGPRARRGQAAAEEAERQEFASLVADFRKGTGPVVIEREREAVK